MKIRQIKFSCLIAIGLLMSACGDSPEHKVEEPVDIQGSEEINDKLLDSMREISREQLDQVEDAGKEALESLSEADRQSLIDLTIEQSAEVIKEDAEKTVDLLEDINGVSE